MKNSADEFTVDLSNCYDLRNGQSWSQVMQRSCNGWTTSSSSGMMMMMMMMIRRKLLLSFAIAFVVVRAVVVAWSLSLTLHLTIFTYSFMRILLEQQQNSESDVICAWQYTPWSVNSITHWLEASTGTRVVNVVIYTAFIIIIIVIFILYKRNSLTNSIIQVNS